MSKKNKKLQLYEKLVNVGVAPALGLIEILKEVMWSSVVSGSVVKTKGIICTLRKTIDKYQIILIILRFLRKFKMSQGLKHIF